MPGNPNPVPRSIQKRQCNDTGGKAVKYHKICSGGSKDDSPLWSIFFQFHAVFGKIFAK